MARPVALVVRKLLVRIGKYSNSAKINSNATISRVVAPKQVMIYFVQHDDQVIVSKVHTTINRPLDEKY
jgi:hypothetical protein